MNKKKYGFNLIEIAIVLAVIGLVIGGIYTAASAVTENNRKQITQKQILQIVANVRATYATQPQFVAPNNATIKAIGLFPGDLTYDGSAFKNAWGDAVKLYDSSAYPSMTNQQFYLSYYGVPNSACVDVLTKGFGSAQLVRSTGLVGAGMPPAYLMASDIANGITVAQATTICNGTSTFSVNPNSNEVVLIFNMRG